VGMVERGEGPGLLLETVEAVEAGGAVGGDDLDGDVAAEAGVAGAVDLARPPGPEGGQKLVRAETVAQ
jgi:hypothetical protein